MSKLLQTQCSDEVRRTGSKRCGTPLKGCVDSRDVAEQTMRRLKSHAHIACGIVIALALCRDGLADCGDAQSCRNTTGILTVDTVAALAYNYRFRCDALVTAIAVARAESGFSTQVTCDNLDPNAGNRVCHTDRGLWQLNDLIYPLIGDRCAYDPTGDCSTLQAAIIYRESGRSFSRWRAFTNGLYRQYLTEATDAAQRITTAHGEQFPCMCEGSNSTHAAARDIQTQLLHALFGASGELSVFCPPLDPEPGQGSELHVEIITSGDPNEKVGNPGAGPARYLSGTPPMSYSIYFDNMPTATAPAQKVVITDQLNASMVDLETLTLDPISFVDKLVTPPSIPLSVLGNYTTDVDLRPAKNLIVRITATLNQSTGVLKWTYTSLAPATMNPTDDPLAGLLPPGTEGSVSFNVMPKTAATGTQITNKATIVFDTNAPIDTPVWSNTLDNTAPTSKVTTLPATVTSASFSVQWSGSDVGAGIGSYDVYGSDNGGAFALWQDHTVATSATFNGQAGHTYRFYSIARDLVGNIEAAKNAAEATTFVNTLLTLQTTALPFPTIGVPYSQTMVATGGATPLLWSITSGRLPSGLILNSATGQITGTATTVTPPTAINFKVTDSTVPPQTVSVTITMSVLTQTLEITNKALPNGQLGVSYTAQLMTSGGTRPMTWEITNGNLPSGLTLNAGAGTISGTPNGAAGTARFTIRVTDSGSPKQSASVTFGLTIAP